jgi:3,4-dihydroxy 2-butanone 4-phosphate synthase/GTP cyclohydrolase II
VDDEDRENEGDLVVAARWITPEGIKFMTHYGRGLSCLAMDSERMDKSQLPVCANDSESHRSNHPTGRSSSAKTCISASLSARRRSRTTWTHRRGRGSCLAGGIGPFQRDL